MAFKAPSPQPGNADHQNRGVKRREKANAATRHAVETLNNGEIERYAGTWPTTFTKGLAHDDYGIVKDGLFQTFFNAVNPMDTDSKRWDFDVPIPNAKDYLTTGPQGDWKHRAWESPLAGHHYDLEGPQASAVGMAPAPQLGSDELVAEMAEVYAMALLRDQEFSDIVSETPEVKKRLNDLNALPWFKKGAVVDADGDPIDDQARNRREARRGKQTGQTVFRGSSPGCNEGPYISQFMLHGNESRNPAGEPGATKDTGLPKDGFINFGAARIDQRVIPQEPGRDYMVSWAEWLDVQNGANKGSAQDFKGPRRFIATPRDLATYVHYDALYQAYLHAALLMLDWGTLFDQGLPEKQTGGTRTPFAMFGGPHILTLVTETATRSLKAVRRQKYNFHCRARPEVVAGMSALGKTNGDKLGKAQPFMNRHIEQLEAAGSLIADLNNANKNNYTPAFTANGKAKPKFDPGRDFMLPMAFPEGSPMHPAYGAGHATVAGSCVTVLKAFFEMYDDNGGLLKFADAHAGGSGNEIFEPAAGGAMLKDIPDVGLTLAGELNKLAANISIGRNMAGVHYYSDYYDSVRMGERVAAGMLQEQFITSPEPMSMTFPSFDGEKIVISTPGDGTATVTVDGGSDATWWEKHLPRPTTTSGLTS